MNVSGKPALYVKSHGAATIHDWTRVKLFAGVITQVPELRTARPVECDTQRGEILYERLSDPQPVSTLDMASLELTLRQVGRLLAAFHSVELPLEIANTVHAHPIDVFGLTAEELACFTALLPCGFFWGDCWQGNVLLVEGQIFFIDPLPNRWLFDGTAIRANGVLDLAMLYMSVFFCHPFHRLMTLNIPAAIRAAEGLLDAYLTTFHAAAAAKGVRRLSRVLAVRHITAARERLALPVALARQLVSTRILNRLDDILPWRLG